MCNEYNGYTNKQTWQVSLWLDNEYNSYTFYTEIATELLENDSESALRELADRIESDIKEANPCQDANMYSDLIGHALAVIDWQEVAQSFIDVATEEMESDDS